MLRIFGTMMAVTLCGAGCSPSPPQSDATIAHRSLDTFLQSWKRGETHAEFQTANPSWTVVEPRWMGKAKLHSFDLPATGKQNGFDLMFTVQIELQSEQKTKKEQAIYSVSTSPKLVIVRTEPGG